MSSEKDILQKNTWSTKHLITAIAIAVSFTFTITLICSRFLFMETEVTTVSERLEKKDSRINERVDKLELRVEELEKPNTDR